MRSFLGPAAVLREPEAGRVSLTRPRSRGGTLSRPTGEGRGEGRFEDSGGRGDRARLFVAVTAERYRNVRRCC